MNTQMLREILAALMEINVKGNDAVTMTNVFRALQQLIAEAEASASAMAAPKEDAE